MTVRQLPNHTSGLGEYYDPDVILRPYLDGTPGTCGSPSISSAAGSRRTPARPATATASGWQTATFGLLRAPTACGRLVGHNGEFPGCTAELFGTPGNRHSFALLPTSDALTSVQRTRLASLAQQGRLLNRARQRVSMDARAAWQAALLGSQGR